MEEKLEVKIPEYKETWWEKYRKYVIIAAVVIVVAIPFLIPAQDGLPWSYRENQSGEAGAFCGSTSSMCYETHIKSISQNSGDSADIIVTVENNEVMIHMKKYESGWKVGNAVYLDISTNDKDPNTDQIRMFIGRDSNLGIVGAKKLFAMALGATSKAPYCSKSDGKVLQQVDCKD